MSLPFGQIIQGDALEALRGLPDWACAKERIH
jgi:hypothetical protein